MKYPRTFHWPWSETIHADDSVHQMPEVFVNEEVVITEKIDGSNACLFGGEVYSRSAQGAPSHNAWLGMARKHHAWKTHDIPYRIYGEDIFGVHSIKYSPVKEQDTFMVFSMFDEHDHVMSWDEIVENAAILDMKTVPVVFRGVFTSIEEITKFFQDNMGVSAIGPVKEGFVIRMADAFPTIGFSRCVAKYVRANHVQTDEHWRKNWKYAELK